VDELLQIGLSNAVVAAVLAVPAVLVSRCCRRPALAHALWLLVLLKLVTPPLFRLPVGWPAAGETPSPPVARATPPPEIALVEDWIVEVPLEWLPAEDELEAVALPPSPEPAAAAAATELQVPWETLLLGGWLAVSAGCLGVAVWRTCRFRRLLPGRVRPRAG
jgi:hypothetical protein